LIGAVLLPRAASSQSKTSGFCFVPQIGVTYLESDFTGIVGVKGLYAKRWGAGLYISQSPYWGFCFGRKIDDLVPVFQNLEVKTFAVRPFSKDFQITFAATLSF
jgi:hypothetical protein